MSTQRSKLYVRFTCFGCDTGCTGLEVVDENGYRRAWTWTSDDNRESALAWARKVLPDDADRIVWADDEDDDPEVM